MPDSENGVVEEGVKSLWMTLWPAWVMANALGWVLIMVGDSVPFYWRWAVALSIGFVLSLFQWLVLQNHLGADYMWIGASTPAYASFLLVIYLFGGVGISLSLLACAGCLGILGLLQRAALSYLVDKAIAWVFASPIAGMIGLLAARYVSSNPGLESPAIFWAILGILYGSITGVVLVGLVKSTAAAKPDVHKE